MVLVLGLARKDFDTTLQSPPQMQVIQVRLNSSRVSCVWFIEYTLAVPHVEYSLNTPLHHHTLLSVQCTISRNRVNLETCLVRVKWDSPRVTLDATLKGKQPHLVKLVKIISPQDLTSSLIKKQPCNVRPIWIPSISGFNPNMQQNETVTKCPLA